MQVLFISAFIKDKFDTMKNNDEIEILREQVSAKANIVLSPSIVVFESHLMKTCLKAEKQTGKCLSCSLDVQADKCLHRSFTVYFCISKHPGTPVFPHL